jgi:LPS-assembly protein
MIHLRKYLRLLLAFLGFSSISYFAYGVNDNTFQSLDSLVPNNTPNYPSCDVRDYYWYQKSGPDTVASARVSESTSMIMKADSITGQKGGTSFASGRVEAYRGGDTINSDWLSFDEPTKHTVAGGNVVLTKEYSVIEGKWVDYYMDLNTGVIKEATLKDSQDDMYANGDSIRLINKKQLQVNNGFLTTCDPNDPAWHITSDSTTFDYQDAQGNARNAKLYVESTQIASFPYFQFPLGMRKSGFLAPEFGVMNSQFANGATDNSVFVGLPYYWNMAPNYDMTIEGKFYTADGFMFTDQFRYQNTNGSGILYTEQVPEDMTTGQYRYYNHFVDDHTILPDLHVGYNYNKVSDDNYFVNFGNFNSTVDNINLNQSIYANYTPSWGVFGVKMQSYQTLQPVNQPTVSPIYAIAPQITLDVKPQPILSENDGLMMGLHSQYTDFTSGQLQTGTRSVIYPSLTLPIQNQWGFVKPKFGWNYTNYQLSSYPGVQNASSTVDRNVPISSIDSGLVFERPLNLGSSSYAQTLEPRIYYLYIPEVNQNNLPVFDTAPATYNISQLFSENRFVGDDRINMANDITVGLNSKLINDNTGVEFSNWGLGYRYFLTTENNFIYGNTTQNAQLFLPQPNVIAELGNKWTPSLNSNLNFQYSTVYQTVDAYNAALRYNPEPHKVLNARFSYQYQQPLLYYAYTPGRLFQPITYENQYALDLSGQWPIFGKRWLVDGRANYDFTAGTILNLLSGLEYNAGCWNMKMLYENYITNVTQRTNAYFLQFQLKGLADLGSDPTSDLRLNIPGYMPVNNTPGFTPITNIH